MAVAVAVAVAVPSVLLVLVVRQGLFLHPSRRAVHDVVDVAKPASLGYTRGYEGENFF